MKFVDFVILKTVFRLARMDSRRVMKSIFLMTIGAHVFIFSTM